MGKTRVAVLRGGPSAEYDVSLHTGQEVLNVLQKSPYSPVDVVITKDGEWLVEGYTRYPENVVSMSDVVFIALHGTYGEDGTVQRLLERHGVPYTGSSSFASRIAMHKALAKDQLRDHDVLMPPHMIVSADSRGNLRSVAESVLQLFSPGYIVKPIASGSSVGIQTANNIPELEMVLKDMLERYDEVLIEKRINGKEGTCGVVERFRGKDIYTLPVVEIRPPESAGFYNREVKYDGTTEHVCPGCFSKSEKVTMEETARKVHELLGLSQYSRSDFMVAPEGIYFLEVNTLPGLTKESNVPYALEAVGGTQKELVEHLIEDALEGKGMRR